MFDVDGTLTESRQMMKENMQEFLNNKLKPEFTVGLVGGSDLAKIGEQVGKSRPDFYKDWDYVFAENGLVSYKNGELVGTMSIKEHLGEDLCQKLLNFALKYMGNIELPLKRGTFIEFRNGMINLCPIGRSCSMDERKQFVTVDKERNIRQNFVDALYKEFPEEKFGIHFAIGGQISIDAFPTGWDKRFCLKKVCEEDGFTDIHFFGDKTAPGGNDHEIFDDARTKGHTVVNPDDTIKQLSELFNL